MSINKKVLSLFLAVVLAITMIPIAAFAQENDVMNSDPNSGSDNQTATTAGTSMGNGANGALIYNLEKREVAVTDFNEDGSYTIQLEKNAFFPYEIQFKYDGQTTVKTFDTIDSTVTVDNHVISVASDYDDDAISQIGVYIDGEYIAAKPEKKTFTNSPMTPFSLLPLTQVNVSLDLSAYNAFQLKEVEVSAILAGQGISGDKKVVWARYYNDDYQIVSQTDKIDLSVFGESFTLAAIVGSALQLDTTNVKYRINVTANPFVGDSAQLYVEAGGSRSAVIPDSDSHGSYSDGEDFYHRLPASYQTAGDFHVGLTLDAAFSGYDATVYAGFFDTESEALAAANSDPSIVVTDKVLNQTMSNTGTGFRIPAVANRTYYNQFFTVVIKNGATLIGTRSIAVAISINRGGGGGGPSGPSSSTYFYIAGESTGADIYNIDEDTYYDNNNHQTVIINDSSFDLTSVKPNFSKDTNATVQDSAGVVQESGVTEQNFLNGPVRYKVIAENGVDNEEYTVSFVKKESGAKLFVNGPDTRDVLLNDYDGNYHDIFFANIGDAQLTNLDAVLINAHNVKIDDYWKVGGTNNNTLAAFTDTYSDYGMGKIRLVPDGNGEISGILRFTSSGGNKDIELRGFAGNPEITTDSLPDGVKYVPYSKFIMTSNIHPSLTSVSFRLSDGTLPEGMTLKPGGDLYGVPKETGTFEIEIEADFSYENFDSAYKTLTLEVLDNTNENVASAWDYNITDFVAGSHGGTMTSYSDWIFRTEGSYDDFVGFWFDGEKLTEGVDYDSKSGSTVITVRAQTFQNAGPGQHTISAEFRQNKDENKELTRSPQNYNANPGGNPNPTNPGGGGNSGGNNSGSSGGSSGGSGGGGSSSNRNNNTPPSPPVNPVAVAQTEAKAADKSLPKLTVKLRGVDLVSLKDLKEIAAIAKKENKTPWLNVDSMSEDGRSVDVRVSINPDLAKNSMNLAGSTYSLRAQVTKKLFEKFFKNELIAVISLMQKGDFGQPAEICVRVPDGTDIEELVFYSYDREANSYRQIKDPNAWIDQKGYLHFTTAYANEIIVSNGKLEQK